MRLISCNIEGSRHVPEVTALLQAEKPDVVCLQEVFKNDVPLLVTAAGAHWWFYTAMAEVNKENPHMEPHGTWGLLQCGKGTAVYQQHVYVAHGEDGTTPLFFDKENPNSINRVLAVAKVSLPEDQPLEAPQSGELDFSWVVATTHFTWSPEGRLTPEQQHDWQSLETFLDQYPKLLLCGDFNSPRADANSIFAILAQKYHDSIPVTTKSTIDPNLHRAGALELVVDGLFHTSNYQVQCEVRTGVSDHCALVADVTKNP